MSRVSPPPAGRVGGAAAAAAAPQLPPAGPTDGLWLDVYAANALSRVGGMGESVLHSTH